MSGKLLLAGGGDIEDSILIDKYFFSLLNNNSRILYIPIALSRTQEGYEQCLEWFFTVIKRHSLIRENNVKMLLEDANGVNLDTFDAIYIGGGNTYKLLKYVLDNNINYDLAAYVDKGGIIYGGSAGAMIFGQDIRTIEEEKEQYICHDALNWLNGYSIYCHYDWSYQQKVLDISKNINSPIYALHEDGGMVFNSRMELIKSVGQVFVIKNGSVEKI